MKNKAERNGRKPRKKLLVILLGIVLILALASLSGNQPAEDTSNTSPKEQTQYIKNYVGKNCASIGYTAVNGKRMDRYGAGTIDLILVTDDGSFVDPEDKETLKNYVVTEQSLAPDTEFTLTFYKSSSGVGYSSLVESQSIEEIELTVKRLASDTVPDEDTEEVTEPVTTEKIEDSSDGIRSEFKAAMDSYESFMNEYVDFMKKYTDNPGDISLLADYADYMSKYSNFVEDFEEWDDDEMNAAETAYYIDVQARVSKKLLEIA